MIKRFRIKLRQNIDGKYFINIKNPKIKSFIKMLIKNINENINIAKSIENLYKILYNN